MDIERTEVILTSKLPGRSVPWDGQLMAIRNGRALYVPVALWRDGQIVLEVDRRHRKQWLGAAGRYASTCIGGGVTLAQEVDRSEGAGHSIN